MTAARKLAAILAADVVGYSRMMGEDEAGTAEAMRERREAVEALAAAQGGRIFKTMGDALFIEFPSVVSAVDCATALQSMMAERSEPVAEDRRIVYRIGVNLRDVLVEGDDLLGDGVNVAARLEGIADPGDVCIRAGARDDRSGFPRSRREGAEEHRPAGPGVRGQRPRRGGAAVGSRGREGPGRRGFRSSCCRSPTSAAESIRTTSSTASPRV